MPRLRPSLIIKTNVENILRRPLLVFVCLCGVFESSVSASFLQESLDRREKVLLRTRVRVSQRLRATFHLLAYRFAGTFLKDHKKNTHKKTL